MVVQSFEGVFMDTKTKTGNLRDHLCFSVYSTSIAINRLYKPMLDPLGLTYPQYLVRGALWEEDAQSIGASADRLALESSTITPLVKRLVTAQLPWSGFLVDWSRRDMSQGGNGTSGPPSL